MKPKELARQKDQNITKRFHTPKNKAQKKRLFDIQDADKVPEPHISLSATSLSCNCDTDEPFIIFAAATGNAQPQAHDDVSQLSFVCE